jgi:protoporphyrinogen oxidase
MQNIKPSDMTKLEEYRDWTLDQVREEVLRRSYFRSLASGDFTFGLKVLAADATGRFKEREVSLAESNAADAKKTEQEKALEFCLDEAREVPAAQEFFRKAFAELKKAKAPK